MKHAAVRYLIASQISLIGGLLLCFLLKPALVDGPRGFSNYGVVVPTIVPYTLAFVLAGALAALAAHRLPPDDRYTTLKRALLVLAALYAIVLISTYPYHLAPWLKALHFVAGSALFSWQILFAAWLLIVGRSDWINRALFAALLTGSLLALLSLLEVIHILSEAQTLTILAFALLLVRSAIQVVNIQK